MIMVYVNIGVKPLSEPIVLLIQNRKQMSVIRNEIPTFFFQEYVFENVV